MRMMNELKPLYLYSASKKVYAPIDEKDKRHNAAVLLLTPDIETSSKLMKLPYIHNPNLFNSFYIDRDISAYIGTKDLEKIEFDEKAEEAISEAMRKNWNSNVKFKFNDEEISIMDKRYAEAVLNQNMVRKIVKDLRLSYLPEKIKVIIYPTVASLQKDAPSWAKSVYKDKLYSYSNEDEIHIISKRVFIPEFMGGTYDNYLKNELLVNLMLQTNPDLPTIPVAAIAQVKSGIKDWIKTNKDGNTELDVGTSEINAFSKVVYDICKKNKEDILHKFIRLGDINIFTKYTVGNTIGMVKKLIFEETISYFDRQNLLPSEFGIPDKRKYPIHDEEHVKLAIKMFNNCDPDEEKELAENIIRKVKQYGITEVKVSAANRFKPYYDEYLRKIKEKEKENKNKPKKSENDEPKLKFRFPSLNKVRHESGSFMSSEYADILHICNHLPKDELDRITFYDTYRDSQFVIKRIIKRVGGEPAGFLDLYQFPSKPEIAQIVIAVDPRFRGQHIADSMVDELMGYELHNTCGFSIYYWTAHLDNYASSSLARKKGFENAGYLDPYGRAVYIRKAKVIDSVSYKDIPDYLKPITNEEDFRESASGFVTESMALLTEADDKEYSTRLKRYLYNERLKNNSEVLEYYDRIKMLNPEIRYTYIKLEMYKQRNLFVDLSYYHGLFLKHNTVKMDKGLNIYFEFINRLMDTKDLNGYPKKTIFIPVDAGIWPIEEGTDVLDFRKNLNPISIIFRLIRTNLAGLKKAWGNKNIIFVGSRGYFTVNFKTFEFKDLARFKINITKLMSSDQAIVDDFEIDDIDDDANEDSGKKNMDTSKARAAKMIDKIEDATNVKLNNVSAVNKSIKAEKPAQHLEMNNGAISLEIPNQNSVVIVDLDPDGPDGFTRLSRTILSNVGNISTYCQPKQ